MEVALLHSHPSPGVKNKKIKKTNKKKKTTLQLNLLLELSVLEAHYISEAHIEHCIACFDMPPQSEQICISHSVPLRKARLLRNAFVKAASRLAFRWTALSVSFSHRDKWSKATMLWWVSLDSPPTLPFTSANFCFAFIIHHSKNHIKLSQTTHLISAWLLVQSKARNLFCFFLTIQGYKIDVVHVFWLNSSTP